MAQGDEGDIEDEYLTCYICYDVFTEPKTLACLHRFCERCLQGYLVGLAESAKKKSFPCPVCREPNPAPDPRKPAADWASLLRTDFHLKNLIKALKGSARSRQATQRLKASTGNSPCTVHADEELDLYCVDCCSSICHLCAGISHRGCSQVITLTEAAADRRATLELRHRHLADRLAKMTGFRAQIDSALSSLNQQQRQAEASIRQNSQAAMAAIRRQEAEQVEHLHRICHKVDSDVCKRLMTLDNQMAGCQQVLEAVRSRMKGATDADVVQHMSALLQDDILNVDEKKLQNILLRLKSMQLQFHPVDFHRIKLGETSLDFSAEHDLSGKGTKSPASTTLSRQKNIPPAVAKRERSRTLPTGSQTTSTTESTAQCRNWTPVKLRTIPGRLREDQHSPKLRDVLVFPAQKIVLVTDWANQCVNAFHERRDRDSRLGLGGKPWCLARVSDTVVAVSLPVSTQICLLKVVPRLMLQSSFFVQRRYSGLAALDTDTLVASGGSDPPCVDIINLGGEVLRSFSRDPRTGRELFYYPGYICMMPEKQNFLVSDRRNAALLCLDLSGHLVFSFRPQGTMAMQEPNGVRTDCQGGIYLAETRGIVKVTAQGQFERAVLRSQDGLQDPRGLDLDSDGLLYVTSNEQDVAVFRIQ